MNARPGTHWFRRAALLSLALTAAGLLLSGASGAATRGRCVTASVPWDFVLPDGSTQPPGSVTLCLSRVESPVSGLHEVRVDRHPIGMYMSRLGRGEDVGPDPEGAIMVFHVTPRGAYRLVGYAVPVGDVLETFRFYDPRAEEQQRSLARAPLLAPDASASTVLLAAATARR